VKLSVPRLDPEGVRLLRAVGCGGDGGKGAGEPIDAALAERAVDEKLAPLLGARLVAGVQIAANPATHRRLVTAHRACVAQEMVSEAALAPYLAALRERGVTAVALKGLALRRSLYGPGERSMVDVDLWVPPHHWALALEAAVAVGARLLGAASRRPLTARLFHEVHAVLPGGFVVDLHRRPHAWPLFPVDPGAVLHRAVEEPDGLRVPAAEDLLVSLATHAAQDGYLVPLRAVAEGWRLATEAATPDAVVAAAQRWRACRATALWLRVLRRCGLPAEPWEPVLHTLDPRGTTRRRAERIPRRFTGRGMWHPWLLKGRVAQAQDSPSRGCVFLVYRGILLVVDRLLRLFSPPWGEPTTGPRADGNQKICRSAVW